MEHYIPVSDKKVNENSLFWNYAFQDLIIFIGLNLKNESKQEITLSNIKDFLYTKQCSEEKYAEIHKFLNEYRELNDYEALDCRCFKSIIVSTTIFLNNITEDLLKINFEDEEGLKKVFQEEYEFSHSI